MYVRRQTFDDADMLYLNIPYTFPKHETQLSRIYFYKVYLFYLGMRDLDKIFKICAQLIRACAGNQIIIYSDNAIRQRRSIYSCHIQGGFP